jgi:hypothetical protein
MTTAFDTLFGPLSKNYCFLFYFFSLFGLIALVFFLVTGILLGVRTKKDSAFYLQILGVSIMYGIIYLQNRILFNMCSHSL